MTTLGPLTEASTVISLFKAEIKAKTCTFFITYPPPLQLTDHRYHHRPKCPQFRRRGRAQPRSRQPVSPHPRGRTESKIKPVQDEIAAVAPSVKTSFVHCDISDVASASAAADAILKLAPSIDVVINCAGIMALKNRELSRQGVERQLATNHLGHFVLTNRLMDRLLKAPNPRVVNVTSDGYQLEGVNFDDPNFEVSFCEPREYPVMALT